MGPIEELSKASQDKLVELNKKGMECLSQGFFKESIINLKMAEKIVYALKNIVSDEYFKLFSLTMNNLGCYYKK